MRPVRFVALSEDGQALVLADEVGRLLALPIDDRVTAAIRREPRSKTTTPAQNSEATPSLSPRDIQARIRAGESADEVARMAGVPVERVLRYAGPVLQERAMLAQQARRTRLKTSESGSALADVVDARLGQHGIDTEKISWDAYRREDGTWRVVATWPSGKATAKAVWELDRTRQVVSPHDEMAQYLCSEPPTPLLGQEPAPEPSGGHGLPIPSRKDSSRRKPPSSPGELPRPSRDPIRAGRDALLASLDRSAATSTTSRGLDTAIEQIRKRPGGAAGLIGGGPGSAFDDDMDVPKEVPAVPSLAVLRPRRTTSESGDQSGKPRKRLPSWDDVLFGSSPVARESS
ncbi:MAG TPA: septation protein SepH [Micromonospora sp.]